MNRDTYIKKVQDICMDIVSMWEYENYYEETKCHFCDGTKDQRTAVFSHHELCSVLIATELHNEETTNE